MPLKIDYANYRKMQEPFMTREDATKALKDFFDAVEKARNDFHIMDVHVITKISIAVDGEEHSAMSSGHFGNELEGGLMCAWDLGQQQERYDELIGSFLTGTRTAK